MSGIPNFSRVSLTEVFTDRAVGVEADSTDITVITPNRRLAAALKRDFDASRAAEGRRAWNSTDILPIGAFVERAYEDAFYSGQLADVPALLTSSQEQVVWEDVIMRSDAGATLLSAAGTARLAREAWEIAHAWHLVPHLRNFPLNEDAKAFHAWSRQYERISSREGRIDRSRLAGLVAELCGNAGIRKPKRLFCYGFDIVTPQQAALLLKLEEAGCNVMLAQPVLRPASGNRYVRRMICDDHADEFHHAAAWARARLEANGTARIGIIVPRLSEHRSAVARVFGSVMEPDVQWGLPGASPQLPFNISLGIALSDYPLVDIALLVLEFHERELEFEYASRLIRSPFLGGGETEMLARARLDARLRRYAEPTITLGQLLTLIGRERGSMDCPILLRRLSAYAAFGKARLSGTHAPSSLARAISEALQIIGFPGERMLDSAEYQALKKWQEILRDFAALDSVTKPASCRGALARLRQMTAEVLFQPETADVPIQILGVLEAAGLAFDHLWVTGLSSDTWPLQSHPNPLLPVELQRSAGLPQGSATASLKLAHRLTEAWFSAAEEVVLSHPRQAGGGDTGEQAPSPLIADIAECETAPVPPVCPAHRDLIQQSGRLESIRDDRTPAIRPGMDTNGTNAVAGGLAVIKDQAACPFRASAVHRLRAETMKTPGIGLGARERGILVHHLLAQVWTRLRTKRALDAISDADLEAVLMQAAQSAISQACKNRPATFTERFAAIEQRRLVRLARAWLDEEKKRGDFTVVAVEEKRSIEIGGLALTTRLDRVDELDDGRRIVIDYKVRAPMSGAMLGDRPEEPQLPLYLVAAEPDAVAVAFAQVKVGDMRFTALVRDDDLLPGIKAFSESRQGKEHESWESLLASWRGALAGLAEDFAGGHAIVDPKKHPHTCRLCEVRLLCRIDERSGERFDEDEDAE